MSSNHRWETAKQGLRCTKCGCTKRALCWVNRFILWTYVRSDGIFFTGQAPPCTPAAAAVAPDPYDWRRDLNERLGPHPAKALAAGGRA